MKTESPPMGRMLKRALQDTRAEMRWIESGRIGFASNGKGGLIMPLVIRKSLNTTGRLFRIREFEYGQIKKFGPTKYQIPLSNYFGIGFDQPVTKKDILLGYLMAARYNNNFKPRVWNG